MQMNLSFTSTSRKPYMRPAKVSDANDIIEIKYGALERYSSTHFSRDDEKFYEDVYEMKQQISVSSVERNMYAVGMDPYDTKIMLGYTQYFNNTKNLFIENLFALKNTYSVGKNLLGHCALVAKYLKLPAIALNSSPGAEGFYEDLGFEEVDIETGTGKRLVLPLYKAHKLLP
jgi:Acetyltransferase (GNAT) domain